MTPEKSTGNVAEVFAAFLKLGLSSFGGPIAHLGYFRTEFVERRRWLNESSFADIVALCQFLPGPASSQVGFTLGILRGNGLLGGLAAWFAFTMPSAIILFAFALGATAFTGPFAEGVLHGLKLVAVAVVAQAIWGMANSLTPDRARAAIALVAVVIVVFIGGSFGQIGAIALGAIAGLWLCRGDGPMTAGHLGFSVSHGTARSRSFFSRCCSWSRRWWLREPARRASRCSTRSIVPARWYSAAAMSCCRCCRRKW